MAWTYSGDPSASTSDEVRFLLGDVKETAQSLSDEEIAYLIGLNSGDAYLTAAEAAGRMAVRYLGLSATTKRVGDLSLSMDYANQAAAYKELQRVLRTGRTANDIGGPYWGDTSSNQFSVGMLDYDYRNPRTRS